MNEAIELLNQGIAAVRAGNREEGRRLLQAALRADPSSEQAWLWLSGVLEDPAQQRDCLQRVLALNPENVAARRGLEQLAAREAASFLNVFQVTPPAQPAAPAPAQAAPEPAAPPAAPAEPARVEQPAVAAPAQPAPASMPAVSPQPAAAPSYAMPEAGPQVPGLGPSGIPELRPPEEVLGSETGIPSHATLPPPRIAPCFFCGTPDVAELCTSCTLPQNFDCPRCGLPVDLRVATVCRCGESMQPYLYAGGVDHERLGDRYLKGGYTAAAVKQWELALPQAKKPQLLHRKIAEAYLDVGLIEKARAHLDASRRK